MHALGGGVDQQAHARHGFVALGPWHHLDPLAKGLGQRLGPLQGAVGDAQLGHAFVQQGHHNGPRRAAGTQNQGRPGIAAPGRVGIAQALDIPRTVVVHAQQAPIGLHHDGVDGRHPTRGRVQLIHEAYGVHFVRHGHIAASKTQGRQTTDGRLQPLWRHRQLHIGPLEPVLGNPVVVDGGRAGVRHRPPYQAGQHKG